MRPDDTNEDMIMAVYEEEVVEKVSKSGLFEATSRIVKRVGSLSTQQVKVNLESFCKQVGIMTRELATVVEGYTLDTLELSVEVTGNGEIRFIASASSEVKGGVKLVFKKSPLSDAAKGNRS
jgi:hypothetical protein